MTTPNSITTIKNMTIDKVTMRLEIDRLKARIAELEEENFRLRGYKYYATTNEDLEGERTKRSEFLRGKRPDPVVRREQPPHKKRHITPEIIRRRKTSQAKRHD